MRNPVTQVESLAVLGAVGVLVWLGWSLWPSLQSLVSGVSGLGDTITGWKTTVLNLTNPDSETLPTMLVDYSPGLAPLSLIPNSPAQADAYSLWTTNNLDLLLNDFPIPLPSDPSTAGMDSHTKTLMDYLRGQ